MILAIRGTIGKTSSQSRDATCQKETDNRLKPELPTGFEYLVK